MAAVNLGKRKLKLIEIMRGQVVKEKKQKPETLTEIKRLTNSKVMQIFN